MSQAQSYILTETGARVLGFTSESRRFIRVRRPDGLLSTLDVRDLSRGLRRLLGLPF